MRCSVMGGTSACLQRRVATVFLGPGASNLGSCAFEVRNVVGSAAAALEEEAEAWQQAVLSVPLDIYQSICPTSHSFVKTWSKSLEGGPDGVIAKASEFITGLTWAAMQDTLATQPSEDLRGCAGGMTSRWIRCRASWKRDFSLFSWSNECRKQVLTKPAAAPS